MRGAALGHAYDPENQVDPLHDFRFFEDVRKDGRVYYDIYQPTLSNFRAPQRAIERMRDNLRGFRLDADDYDILFNGETRRWCIVKWVKLPQPMGKLPGLDLYMGETCWEPWDVYDWDARERGPDMLGEQDWMNLRRRCLTMRDPAEISHESYAHNSALLQQDAELAAEFERELAAEYHARVRALGVETGIAYASPEEMAAKVGGTPADWDEGRAADLAARALEKKGRRR